MATASNILKNCNVFIDGRGYAGNFKELQIPKLTDVDIDFRSGGMNAPVALPMGHEKLEFQCDFPGYLYEILILWGVGQGKIVPIVARGALESFDGKIESAVAHMTGRVRTFDPAPWKSGEECAVKLEMNVYAYKFSIGARVAFDIDIINMRHFVDGKDQLAEQRNALGI